MIDTHSHIYSEQFNGDRDEVVERAFNAGVTDIILPAVDSTTHSAMFEVANTYNNHYPTIGVHPTSIKEDWERELDIAHELLQRYKDKIVAIGEIGLDAYWDTTFFKQQEVALHRQLEWAIDNNLPAIVHTRECWDEMINLLSDYKGSPLRVVLHGYSGTPQQADRVLSLGDHLLGIGGVLTYKKSTLPDVIKEISLERLVTETDAPYLTPVPYRGKRNESSYIPIIIQSISTTLDKDMRLCAEITTKNAKDIFKF